MDMQDKERAEKIRETLGDACGIIELQRVSEDDALHWAIREAEAQQIRLNEDAARELVDALGAEMLTLSSELSKLILYAQSKTPRPSSSPMSKPWSLPPSSEASTNSPTPSASKMHHAPSPCYTAS